MIYSQNNSDRYSPLLETKFHESHHKSSYITMDSRCDSEEKACCITGHRDIPQEKRLKIEAAIRAEIRAAIADGYSRFISGFADGSDLMFASIVVELKKKMPNLWLEAAIPYTGRVRSLKRDFLDLMAACDSVKIISAQYTRDCFHARNRYMVEKSSRVIAVYDGRERGGTVYTMHYANKLGRELRVILV